MSGYSESLAQMIRSAEASESPDEILAVARRLEQDGFLEDAVEWRKWFAHLRPGDAVQAARSPESADQAVLGNLARSIASLRVKAPRRLLGYLDEAQRAVDGRRIPAAERALLLSMQQRANFDQEDGGEAFPRSPILPAAPGMSRHGAQGRTKARKPVERIYASTNVRFMFDQRGLRAWGQLQVRTARAPRCAPRRQLGAGSRWCSLRRGRASGQVRAAEHASNGFTAVNPFDRVRVLPRG